MVQDNEVDMRVVHSTTRAFHELAGMRGIVQKDLELKMEQFDRARLYFSAPIVRNLSMQRNCADQESLQALQSPLTKYETSFGKGSDSCAF